MRSYSLWRGGKLLGRFEERHPVTHHDKSVGAGGFLEPTADFVGISSMMQTCLPVIPGKPIFQHPLAPITMASITKPSTGSKGPQELKPLSDAEARGVPENLVFRIRDSDDRWIETTMVSLHLHVIPDDADAEEIHRAKGIPGTSNELWHISFATMPPTLSDW